MFLFHQVLMFYIQPFFNLWLSFAILAAWAVIWWKFWVLRIFVLLGWSACVIAFNYFFLLFRFDFFNFFNFGFFNRFLNFSFLVILFLFLDQILVELNNFLHDLSWFDYVGKTCNPHVSFIGTGGKEVYYSVAGSDKKWVLKLFWGNMIR